MAAEIISGKKIAEQIRSELVQEIEELKGKGMIPGLATVLVGDNPASQSYVRSKNKAAHEMGIHSEQHNLDKETSEEDLLALIDKLNAEALKKDRDKTVAAGLSDLEKMTLTMVDGDFPREVLGRQNLTFAEYKMPNRRNSSARK